MTYYGFGYKLIARFSPEVTLYNTELFRVGVLVQIPFKAHIGTKIFVLVVIWEVIPKTRHGKTPRKKDPRKEHWVNSHCGQLVSSKAF